MGVPDMPAGLPVTAEDVTVISAAVAPFLGAALLQYLPPLATLAGVALTIYARWDDARRKLR